MRKKKAIVNVITSLLVQMIHVICGFIIPKLIISQYGSNVNGLVSSITQFLGFISLLEAGFGPVIKSVIYKPIAEKDKTTIEKILKASEKIFRKISYIFICYIVILCVILPATLTDEFDSLFTLSLILIISISTFAEYYFGMIYRLYLQAEQKSYVVYIIQIATLILNAIVVVLLIHFNASIHTIKIASSLIFVLRPIIQKEYVKRKYKINLKNVENTYKISQRWEGMAQHIAYVVHKNTDIAILTLCGNLAEISVYSVYGMVIEGLKRIMQSFSGGIDAAFGDMIAKGEQENLNKSFSAYEGLYYSVATIIFSTTLFLIVPFISIYTQGITDVNYIRPEFAYLVVFAEFICIIRQPYNDLVKASGHFKQTRIGAWIEAISNVVISFVLVWNYGLVGVAIGTLFAMAIRTIEFKYHTSKYILKRKISYTFKRFIMAAIEIGLLTIIVNKISFGEITNYLSWIINALIVFSLSTLIVIGINSVVFNENVKNIISKTKTLIIKKG